MTIDVRANVICNLGKLVSGEVSDELMMEGGLIKTTGTLVLEGTTLHQRSKLVELAYYRPQVNTITRFPRTLRVLKAYADPFRNRTTVEIGCKLALMDTLANAKDRLPLTSYTFGSYSIAAQAVIDYCLAKVGITVDPGSVALTSTFLRSKFDLGTGYLNIIHDLLRSEICYGVLTVDEKLLIRKLNLRQTVNAPVLSDDDLIDLQPITGAEEPGDQVSVTFNNVERGR